MRKDPTEFRERFKRWKAGERVYDSGQTLPAYEDGKTPDDLTNNRSQDEKEISWMYNWLNQRRDVLLKNAESVGWGYDKYYPKRTTGDVRDAGWRVERYANPWNPFTYFNNSDPTRNRVNKLIYAQIENARNTPKTEVGSGTSSDYNLRGAYVEPNYWDNSGHYVAFAGTPDSDVKVHEFTHASHPKQLEYYIMNNIFGGDVPNVTYKKRSNLENAKEIYGALQQFRYKNNLKPELKITKDWLQKNLNLFEDSYLKDLPDDIKLKLFNDVAMNDKTNNGTVVYANYGKSPKRYEDGKTPEETYYGKRLPDVTIEAQAPYAYQDQFTGLWYGIGYGGKKTTKGPGFNPSGARVVTDPKMFDDLRLLLYKLDDPKHTESFKEWTRDLATSLVTSPIGAAWGMDGLQTLASETGSRVGSHIGETPGIILKSPTLQNIGSFVGGFLGGGLGLKVSNPNGLRFVNLTDKIAKSAKVNVRRGSTKFNYINGFTDYYEKMRRALREKNSTVEYVPRSYGEKAAFVNLYRERLLQLPIQPIDLVSLFFKTYLEKTGESFTKDAAKANLLTKVFQKNPEYAYYLMEKFKDFPELIFSKLNDSKEVSAFLDRLGTAIRGIHTNNGANAAKDMLTNVSEQITNGGDRLNSNHGLYTSNTFTIADRFKNPQGFGKETGYVGTAFSDLGISRQLTAEEMLSQYRDAVLPAEDSFVATGIINPENTWNTARALESQYMTGSGKSIADNISGYERAYVRPSNGKPFEKLLLIDLQEYPNATDAHGRWGYGVVPQYNENLFIPRMLNNGSDFIKFGRRAISPKKIIHLNQDAYNKAFANVNKRINDASNLISKNRNAYLGILDPLKRLDRVSNNIIKAMIPIAGFGYALGQASQSVRELDKQLKEKYGDYDMVDFNLWLENERNSDNNLEFKNNKAKIRKAVRMKRSL